MEVFKIFQKFECFFGVFVLYRIRILCIELYMGTWFKTTFLTFSRFFKKRPRRVNNFRTGHYVRDVWGLLVLNGLTSLKHPSEGCITWYTTVAAAAVAAVAAAAAMPSPARPGLARRCYRCCRYCGIFSQL